MEQVIIFCELSAESFLVPIQDGLSAAVQVVEFLLGHRVIDVHGRDTQFSSFGELIQSVGGGEKIILFTLIRSSSGGKN